MITQPKSEDRITIEATVDESDAFYYGKETEERFQKLWKNGALARAQKVAFCSSVSVDIVDPEGRIIDSVEAP